MIKLLFSTLVAFTSVAGIQAQVPVLVKSENKDTDNNRASRGQKVVIVSGARFSYKLVQKWIDEYYNVNPDVQIIIESRGSSDPSKVDVLVEVYEQEPAVADTREFVNVGRYAILPVATAQSQIAHLYGKKGFTRELIQQVYFHNIFADHEKQEEISTPYTVYTRLQRAGAPIVFAKYFGFEQKDINGKAVAGSDEHLLKALLRDSTGISYLPLALIYDHTTRKTIEGLTVIPVDIDGNGKITDEEKFFQNESEVIERIEAKGGKGIKNIPVEYLHLSVDKKTASPEAIAFLVWVNENGERYLNEFGYLKPEPGRSDKSKFKEFASRRAP
jgi:phosphate transport system substrate-binding protein